ncbi:Asp-tRNA(Asn)/Glu-tRNA(Gln) amidotransferase subunit GatB [Methanosalsum natronophilum]|uniref:Aspartyl/glutamyl-tRNA(Asn/Gln) amidotransferase subunit B n=1 Tax=Methanosalsum natronophilum TaxID=768733 RepID=A0A3R7XGC2_9EURY|nr:Asp-tRNA(Asn)/Glu-tRNA(Gln) amidotransferase subunit GatB [Methanosalsum natronophilum]MCS3923144.1 aspartyl-tRNA(Asn)/glutamyl-tRNA(Gln) amidotransferase subunit B [Methanosalsum natronophilum]RQD82340.1 MAG: Asp-tRNA(Asn)/Glu-tRNA(Gln) amidotransferase subunit GatB [Methanosalsum natronophilum]
MSYSNTDGIMIGLEIHVQLNRLKTKMFCGCSTQYHSSPPNTHVCPVCLGLPGALPVINQKAVESAMKVGLALNCEIVEQTQFHRKNYYYPDLPKGYQVSQFDYPIVSNGKVAIEGEDGELVIRIRRAHMEEDPGKLIHMGSIDKSKGTLIDYNRSGMALLEIVTEPDIRSPKEARRFLDKLRNILEYLDVFDSDLEGAMRVDANISLQGGDRTEIKNISSHKGAERALLYEIMRQKNLLRRGEIVTMETRHFDEARGVTTSMRSKEEEHDYRYFPEPDLVPLRVKDRTEKLLQELPELPDAKKERLISQYSISDMHAKALVSNLKIANFYEEVASEVNPKVAATWIADVLKGELNYRDLTIDACKVEDIVQLVTMIMENKITDRSAVEVIRTLLDSGGNCMEIVEKKGLVKVEDNVVEQAVDDVLGENKNAINDYLNGKEQSLNFLVGQVMKKTRGRADPMIVRDIIANRIK